MTRFAGQELPQLRLVEIDRLAAQQVLDLDAPDAGHLHLALKHLVEAGDDADVHLNLPAETDEVEDLRARDLRDRDDDLLDAVVPHQARQLLGRAEDPDPVDHRTVLLRVVVDESLDVEVHVAAAGDLADGEHTRSSCADEQRGHALADGVGAPLPPLRDFIEVAAKHPQSEHAAERQDGAHQDDREWNPPARQPVRNRKPQDRERQSGPHRRVDERLDLPHSDVAPDEAVDAGQGEGGGLNQDDVGQLLKGVVNLLLRHRELEAEEVGENEREHEDRQVQARTGSRASASV